MSTSTQPRLTHDDPGTHEAFVPTGPLSYRFTIAAKVTSLVAERSLDLARRAVPGGSRLYIEYTDGTVKTYDYLADPGDPDYWEKLSGTILTSGDWALLRSDGVLALDARMTIEVSLPEDGNNKTKLSALFWGVANLALAYPKGPRDENPDQERTGEEAYQLWLKGEPPTEAEIPVKLMLRFDAPSPAPISGTIAERYVKASLHADRYSRLGRNLYVGIGRVTLKTNKDLWSPDTGFAEAVAINVYEVGDRGI